MNYQELKKWLRYEPETGLLYWIKDAKGSAKKGVKAGTTNKYGVIQIQVKGHVYKAHRIAWFLYYGQEPKYTIDHINHDRTDNRICNLRDVEQVENNKNKPLQRNNKSGVAGVRWHESGKWYSVICVNRRTKWIGSFDTLLDAVSARKSAEIIYSFHKNHGRT